LNTRDDCSAREVDPNISAPEADTATQENLAQAVPALQAITQLLTLSVANLVFAQQQAHIAYQAAKSLGLDKNTSIHCLTFPKSSLKCLVMQNSVMTQRIVPPK